MTPPRYERAGAVEHDAHGRPEARGSICKGLPPEKVWAVSSDPCSARAEQDNTVPRSLTMP
jgi:hypothetical protein